jgi:hypothetical protein
MVWLFGFSLALFKIINNSAKYANFLIIKCMLNNLKLRKSSLTFNKFWVLLLEFCFRIF